MANLVQRRFSEYDFAAIEAAVKQAESHTGGEIAVEATAQSRNWFVERLIYSLSLGFVSAIIAALLTRENDWGFYYNLTQIALWGTFGFFVVYFGLGRFLKRQSRRQKFVWLKAVNQFGKLRPVRNLAGVLIFVSLREDEAAIVADKGIADKVTPEYWRTLRENLVEALSQGKSAEGIIRAIEVVGQEMANHFPREDDDVNELPDAPRIVE